MYSTMHVYYKCHIFRFVENEPEASSIHLLSRPEHMLTKCMSFSSVDSDQSEAGSRNGLLSRAGTMSEGAVCRRDITGRDKMRPMSEIPQGVRHKELEASFEVSTNVGMHN